MKLHRRVARLFGYELIKRRRSPTRDAHLAQLLERHRIDLVLDVGANAGQFGTLLRQEGYRGDIHSFEPVSSTFARLEACAASDARWHAHQLALGDAPGERTIHVSAASDLSSLLPANEFGRQRYGDIAPIGQEKVRVSTVDDFLNEAVPDFASRKIFLKMDTQGYDLQVFAGARRCLPHIDALMSELSMISIYSGMPHYLEALRTYEESGFLVTGIFPISRKRDLSVVEMDCLMIHRRIASHD